MHTTNPTDEEVAAVIAAVRCFLAAEQQAVEAATREPPSAWRNAARVLAQGIARTRLPTPGWGNLERLKRLI